MLTNDEKLERLAVLILPDEATDDLLLYILEQAEGIVMNRRYPFGIPEGAKFPIQYEYAQLRIAVEIYSKMGAEGQIQHQENGTLRTWEAGDISPSLLRGIMPMIGSVG